MLSEQRSGFPCSKMLSAAGTKYIWLDTSWDTLRKAVCLSQNRDSGQRLPSIRCDEYWKQLGNKERSRGMNILQSCQGPQCFGGVTGQPKPTCYREGISHSKQAKHSGRIHSRYHRVCQSIPAQLSNWWRSCVQTIRKNPYVTSFDCK
jgi:hypothetical protein